MQMKIDRPTPRDDAALRPEPVRTDRYLTGDDQDVGPTDDTSEEPVVIGPDKARAATTNRMPARVLMIGLALVVTTFLLGYLLVR